MGRRDRAIVQTDAGGSPVLVADSLNLRDAEAALVRDAVKHAETLAVAAAMLGLEGGMRKATRGAVTRSARIMRPR